MSCYRCLRSFRNRIDHAQLDRFMGIALAEYLLDGELSGFAPHRLATAADLLHTDLRRYETAERGIERLGPITDAAGNRHEAALALRTAAGETLLVVVTNPLEEIGLPQSVLTPGGETAQLLKVSELHVRKNLARVTRQVMDFIE